MSELRFHPGDPARPTRSARIDARSGTWLAAMLTGGGLLTALGLAGAPELVADLGRSADRLALRETARRGQEALDFVRRRHGRLARRLAADELFLSRVAVLAEVTLPPGVPGEAPEEAAAPTSDPEAEVARLGRRAHDVEAFRRLVAVKTQKSRLEPALVPSRSPVEPGAAVPVGIFGPRVSPLTGRREFFPGLALAAPAGTVVVAPAEGTVAYVGLAPRTGSAGWRALGTLLVLAHGGDTWTVYGHLASVLVRRKQAVKRGDPIARVGQTGWSAAPQLHYEVRRWTGSRAAPLDPRVFILDADWMTAAELRQRPAAPAEEDLPPAMR